MDLQLGSLIVAIAALLVSALSGLGAYRVQRGQTQLQNRLLALEATRERARNKEGRKAKLVAHVVGFGSDRRLSIRNEGAALAQRVQIQMDDQPLAAHTLWVHGQDEVTEIGPGAHIDYLLGIAMGKPTMFMVEVTWTDESGEPGHWKSQLNV